MQSKDPIVDRFNEFSFDLIRNLVVDSSKIDPPNNLVNSGYSLLAVLLMASLGSNGTTQQELAKSLRIDPLKSESDLEELLQSTGWSCF